MRIEVFLRRSEPRERRHRLQAGKIRIRQQQPHPQQPRHAPDAHPERIGCAWTSLQEPRPRLKREEILEGRVGRR